MNYRDKTKDDLIKDLKKLQQEHDLLKASYKKCITENKLAEDKLSRSERHYHTLFDAIDEGFCIVKVIFDVNEKPIDYRFLEINPSFEKQTGLINVQGKRIRELAPKHEEHWFEIYGKIAVTGQPLRFENIAKQLNRWYDVYAFRVGQPQDRQVAILFNDITARKRVESELRLSQKRLEKLAVHLEEVREKERSQIALNLHDDIGQKLTAMNLNIAWVKSRIGVQSPVVKNKLENINLLINETFENIREISTDLRPSILFDFGLIEAVRLQLKKFGDLSGIKYSFNYNPFVFKIDTQISLVIYWILQESLTNIIRHSHASFTEVSLNMINSKVEMIIKDNGKGIEEEKINSLNSMGIAGINERVGVVRGKLVIEGKKGTGTTIKVSIPIKSRKKHD
jgi:signal transduction histidine kinase